eukprot:superscaffoldBa00013715_g26105
MDLELLLNASEEDLFDVPEMSPGVRSFRQPRLRSLVALIPAPRPPSSIDNSIIKPSLIPDAHSSLARDPAARPRGAATARSALLATSVPTAPQPQTSISSSYFLFSSTYIPCIYIPPPQHPFLLSGSYLCCPFPPDHLSCSPTHTNHSSCSDSTNNSGHQRLHNLTHSQPQPFPGSRTSIQQLHPGHHPATSAPPSIRPALPRVAHPQAVDPNRELLTSFSPLELPARSKDLTVAEFAFAFSLYRDIICSAFPDRRSDLDDYLSLILDLALRFSGNGYSYHILFASQAAGHFQQFNQGMHWETSDHKLYWRVFAARASLRCEMCGAPSHPAAACTLIAPLPRASVTDK